MRTGEGRLHLSAVIDLNARMVVGWSLSERMTADIVVRALESAKSRGYVAGNAIFHADRGAQYTSRLLAEWARANDVRLSCSRTGNCHDNAVAESFFATLKNEMCYRRSFPTRDSAKHAVIEFIEAYYNRRRPHSTIGYKVPAEPWRPSSRGPRPSPRPCLWPPDSSSFRVRNLDTGQYAFADHPSRKVGGEKLGWPYGKRALEDLWLMHSPLRGEQIRKIAEHAILIKDLDELREVARVVETIKDNRFASLEGIDRATIILEHRLEHAETQQERADLAEKIEQQGRSGTMR